VLIDGCQSAPHMPLDMQAMDCDWFVASGHKMCGPTGIGFLYGKLALLEEMPPFLGGGEMIADVFFDHSTYADLPHKFEAGTPAIGEAIALGAAVDYLSGIGMDKIADAEHELTAYLYEQMQAIPEVKLYGPCPKADGSGRAALATFTVEGVHAQDLSTLLDQSGVAIRSGHHCTQPLHREFLGVDSTARASLYFYNTKAEIDVFIAALKDTIDFLRNQLWLSSIACFSTRSMSRPVRSASSCSILTRSSKVHGASGIKDTSTSMSLSARKSSRRTEPNSASSTIRHFMQNCRRAFSDNNSFLEIFILQPLSLWFSKLSQLGGTTRMRDSIPAHTAGEIRTADSLQPIINSTTYK
jgi:hypothetical protein